jgi:hypothetical protein
MEPVLLGVVVGSLGTVLVGTMYFLWVRANKKAN